MRPTPSVVVAAYAQNFVDGRKVVIFGDCTSGLAEQLVERGARLVHVYDTDLTRAAEAAARGNSPNIAFGPLGQSGVTVRDGSFDVGVVENLAATDDPAGLLKRLRRALAARGLAFVLSPNLEVDPQLLADPAEADTGPSYYELYELVSREFSEVRMVGQAPFVGYALADFSPGRGDEFSIDTALVPGGAEEVEWYLAVVSHFPVVIDPFSVVQLPAAAVLPAVVSSAAPIVSTPVASAPLASTTVAAAPAAPQPDPELARTRQELEQRDAWATELEARAAAADERADQAESRGDALEAELVALKAELVSGQLDGVTQRAELVAVRAEVTALKEQLRHSSQEARHAKQRLDDAKQRLDDAERALTQERDHNAERVKRAGQDLEQTSQRLQAENERQKVLLAARSSELEEARQTQEQLVRDLDQAEAQLRERASAVEALRREVRNTEQLAQQLLADLEASREPSDETGSSNGAADASPSASAEAKPAPSGLNLEPQLRELQQRLAELARVDALRVADLTAAQWTVQELETRLADSLASSRAEVEQLRGELQQKLVLLEQLQGPEVSA